MIVGKAGRADTPTDPSPLDMVESVITLRPKEHWPKRKLDTRTPRNRRPSCWQHFRSRGLIEPDQGAIRAAAQLLDPATMNATMRMDETMRELVLQRFPRFEADARRRSCCASSSSSWSAAGRKADRLLAPVAEADIDRLAAQLQKDFAPILSAGAGPGGREPADPANRREAGGGEEGRTQSRFAYRQVSARSMRRIWPYRRAWASNVPRCSPRCADFLEKRRDAHWREQVAVRSRASSIKPWRPMTGTPSKNSTSCADEKGLWAEEDLTTQAEQRTDLAGRFVARVELRRAPGRLACSSGRKSEGRSAEGNG